jgi:CubicO group peptidase (beta-lactamase class C family)
MTVAKIVMVGVLAACLLAPTVAMGQSQLGIYLEDRIVGEGKGQALDAYLTELAETGFGGAVLVAEGNGVILHHGYGLADAETGIRNYSITSFSTGSLTRLFTVVTVLQQIDELIIAPDDPLDRFFNGVPSDKQGITIHDLLTGSSGLAWIDEAKTAGLSADEIVAEVLKQPLQFATGEKSAYSPADYFLLGRMIEIITAYGLEVNFRNSEFVNQWMTRTGITLPFFIDSLLARTCVKEAATKTATEYVRAHPELMGVSGVVSTVGDLYRWWKGVSDAIIISTEGLESMLTPFVPSSDDTGVSSGYGWQITQSRTGDTLQFVSSYLESEGWGCALYNYRGSNTTIIVMTNCPFGEGNPADAVARNLSSIVIGDREVATPTEGSPLDGTIER